MKAATSNRPVTSGPVTTGNGTIKSIVQDQYGGAPEEVLRLADLAKPEIGDDEILVRVHAASVDRGTWHLMTGLPYAMRVMGFGFRSPKAANPGRPWPGQSPPLAKTSPSSSLAMMFMAPATALSPSTSAPALRGSHPSRRTCPSSRRQQFPFLGSPPCKPCVTGHTWKPARRYWS